MNTAPRISTETTIRSRISGALTPEDVCTCPVSTSGTALPASSLELCVQSLCLRVAADSSTVARPLFLVTPASAASHLWTVTLSPGGLPDPHSQIHTTAAMTNAGQASTPPKKVASQSGRPENDDVELCPDPHLAERTQGPEEVHRWRKASLSDSIGWQCHWPLWATWSTSRSACQIPRSTGRPHSHPTTPSGCLAKWPLRWSEPWWRREGLSCRSAGCIAQPAFSA